MSRWTTACVCSTCQCTSSILITCRAGGQGYSDETFVEYDLDKEDEAWLLSFNAGQPRISSAKLETMLWVLVRDITMYNTQGLVCCV